MQHQFASELAVGLSEEDLMIFEKCMNKFESNINRIKMRELKMFKLLKNMRPKELIL